MFKMCTKCGFMYDDNGNGCPQCGTDKTKQAEEQRKAEEERKRTEEARLLEEARLAKEAEEQRKAEEERKKAEEARLLEEARLAKEAEEQRKAEEERKKAEEARLAEEVRLAKEAEEQRKAEEERKRTEESHLAENIEDQQKANNLFINNIPSVASNQESGTIVDNSKKKSKKKWAIPVVIVLVLAVVAGVTLMIQNSRCYYCNHFLFPGTECNWCGGYGYIDDEDIEYADDLYAYSNNLPGTITEFEAEGYYVTWYEDGVGNYLYDGVSGYTYDELLDYHGDELEGYDDFSPEICWKYRWGVAEDEYLCIAFYQYRWVI